MPVVILAASAREVAVDAIPAREPTKLEAVIIPDVLMFDVVPKPTAVVAVPVRVPTKLEAVIIPDVLIFDVVPKPTAVVAVPVRVPTKLEAVTELVNLPVPTTSKL